VLDIHNEFKFEVDGCIFLLHKVAAGWEKLAFPSLKSLSVWHAELAAIIDKIF
jgi:hypothetical protein